MIEQDVVIKSGSIALSGTMALPDVNKQYPAVLFIAGSGEVDRNENHKKMPMNVFNELTGQLTAQGLATLRYDKRGVGKSEGHFLSTGFFDNVRDAQSALGYLKQHENIDSNKIFIAGHSEGAYTAVKIAAEERGIAGVILIAGGARKGEEELMWQAEQVIGSLKGFTKWLVSALHIDPSKSQRKVIDKIYQSDKDWFRVQVVNKINAKWMREFLDYDPAPDLAGITVPVLAINGSKDIQVDPGNLDIMDEIVKAPFEKYLVPNVTHMLREEGNKQGLSGYKQQVGKPVDPRITSAVINWLKANLTT